MKYRALPFLDCDIDKCLFCLKNRRRLSEVRRCIRPINEQSKKSSSSRTHGEKLCSGLLYLFLCLIGTGAK